MLTIPTPDAVFIRIQHFELHSVSAAFKCACRCSISLAVMPKQFLYSVQPVSVWVLFGCLENHQLNGPCLVVGLVSLLGEDLLVMGISFLLLRVHSMEEREDQRDRLDFVRNQLNILTEDTKEKIKRVTEEVENKVSKGNMKNHPDSSVVSSAGQLLYVPTHLTKCA